LVVIQVIFNKGIILHLVIQVFLNNGGGIRAPQVKEQESKK
jgi:hypothetical protein